MNKATVGMAIAALALGLTGCTAGPTSDAQTPDWTVAYCSMWSDTEAPVLPPYTRTDVCAAPDGTLMWAPVDVQLETE